MKLGVRALTSVLGAAGMLAMASTIVQAQCTSIGGRGTGTSVDDAKFQAYEAMLQGTDWGMWASWMASGAKVGVAPGYAVKGLKFRCKPGGMLGQECRSWGTLCKKA